MNIQKVNIQKLKIAEYNPRKKLTPEDPEYQKLKKSILEFGYVMPIVVNSDMTVIGGHQGLTVLKDLGHEEVDCNIVNLNKIQEKALNLALNKIDGIWDNDKLEKILEELKEADIDLLSTGFDEKEIEKLFKESEEIINDNEEIDVTEFEDGKFQCQCPKCGFMFDIKK